MNPADKVQGRFGYVAIVGRPNVGKSTLLNRILGTKLSITSRKPQTTRHTVLGIKTTGPVQTAYVDTPGLQFQQQKKIHQRMNRSVFATAQGVDLVVMVIDGLVWNQADQAVLETLKKVDVPVILAVNKIDRLQEKEKLLPHLDWLANQYAFAEIIPVSALNQDDVSHFESVLERYLPEGEHLYEADELTDRPERFFIGEIVREKIIRQLGEEVPYEVAVEVEHFLDKPHLLEIHALILVEKQGQKKIVIGKGGSRIKKIGEEARRDMEKFLQKKVLLKLWVKVKTGWSDSDRALKSLGLE
jgi:GTP-binding protein Era